MEEAVYPYDFAYQALGFHRPAVRVASCEGARKRLLWSRDFEHAFDRRLARLGQLAAESDGAGDRRSG